MTNRSELYILVINCGSSSLKFSLYDATGSEPGILGSISGIG
ncbi:hypothetical protein [Mucilaginibacter gilvus]|uniref:Uncharacterized protein n=1 Tax=Mucilaginibacter gilvus TaxID=2305909 RepID=A0A444MRU7_9SPHI|nr:hypothetical protein [Mucilaginibacter gilvus]RWY54351.1 hypothetical protein EPL05_09970 [Mucilaginibacter gilvus]